MQPQLRCPRVQPRKGHGHLALVCAVALRGCGSHAQAARLARARLANAIAVCRRPPDAVAERVCSRETRGRNECIAGSSARPPLECSSARAREGNGWVAVCDAHTPRCGVAALRREVCQLCVANVARRACKHSSHICGANGKNGHGHEAVVGHDARVNKHAVMRLKGEVERVGSKQRHGWRTVNALPAIAKEPRQAGALEAAVCVCALGVHIAVVEVKVALVNVLTLHAVTFPSSVARARKVANGVGACCIGVAVVQVTVALIHVLARRVGDVRACIVHLKPTGALAAWDALCLAPGWLVLDTGHADAGRAVHTLEASRTLLL